MLHNHFRSFTILLGRTPDARAVGSASHRCRASAFVTVRRGLSSTLAVNEASRFFNVGQRYPVELLSSEDLRLAVSVHRENGTVLALARVAGAYT